jgi:uncharacterized protein with NRDE domain
MCIILWAEDAHPRYDLVLVANRDEFYDRPTTAAHWWDGSAAERAARVLAGRDEVGRGSWLGVTRAGRFCALTNVRCPMGTQRVDAKSRGKLVSDFLVAGGLGGGDGSGDDDAAAAAAAAAGDGDGDAAAAAYLASAVDSAAEYNGYNLLVGTLHGGLHCYSNAARDEPGAAGVPGAAASPPPPPTRAGGGVHGLCNSWLDDDSWPKVRRGKAALAALLRGAGGVAGGSPGDGAIDPAALFALAASTVRPPRAEDPDTGVGAAWERLLSPLFVRAPSKGYGTVSAAVLLVERGPGGRALLVERSFDRAKCDAAAFTERRFEFQVGGGGRGAAGGEAAGGEVREGGAGGGAGAGRPRAGKRPAEREAVREREREREREGGGWPR